MGSHMATPVVGNLMVHHPCSIHVIGRPARAVLDSNLFLNCPPSHFTPCLGQFKASWGGCCANMFTLLCLFEVVSLLRISALPSTRDDDVDDDDDETM